VARLESAAAIRSAISLLCKSRAGGDCGESCLFVVPEEALLVLLCPTILGTRFHVDNFTLGASVTRYCCIHHIYFKTEQN
jgi:hypothetical protein